MDTKALESKLDALTLELEELKRTRSLENNDEVEVVKDELCHRHSSNMGWRQYRQDRRERGEPIDEEWCRNNPYLVQLEDREEMSEIEWRKKYPFLAQAEYKVKTRDEEFKEWDVGMERKLQLKRLGKDVDLGECGRCGGYYATFIFYDCRSCIHSTTQVEAKEKDSMRRREKERKEREEVKFIDILGDFLWGKT